MTEYLQLSIENNLLYNGNSIPFSFLEEQGFIIPEIPPGYHFLRISEEECWQIKQGLKEEKIPLSPKMKIFWEQRNNLIAAWNSYQEELKNPEPPIIEDLPELPPIPPEHDPRNWETFIQNLYLPENQVLIDKLESTANQRAWRWLENNLSQSRFIAPNPNILSLNWDAVAAGLSEPLSEEERSQITSWFTSANLPYAINSDGNLVKLSQD